MENKIIDILLVEDNPNDAELAIRALKKRKLANNLIWVKDGEEALDFLYSKNQYSNITNSPKLIFSTLNYQKSVEFKLLEKIKKTKI